MRDIYRHRKNRNRVCALQYTGENVRDLEIFTEHRVFKFKDTTSVRCNGCDIKKNDWVVRKIIEVDEFQKQLGEVFTVMNDYNFNKIYRQRKHNDSRGYSK